jgi:hypothetical protein
MIRMTAVNGHQSMAIYSKQPAGYRILVPQLKLATGPVGGCCMTVLYIQLVQATGDIPTHGWMCCPVCVVVDWSALSACVARLLLVYSGIQHCPKKSVSESICNYSFQVV